MPDAMEDPRIKRLKTEHPRQVLMREAYSELLDVLYDGVRHNLEKYLPQVSTGTFQAELRKTLARFKGETPGIVWRMVGAVFGTPPQRHESITRDWGHIIENADGSGASLNQFMEDALFEALGFGATAILVDRPRTDEDGNVATTTSKDFQEVQVTRAPEQRELVLRRFLWPQFVNGSVDARKEWNWMRFREVEHRQVTPDEDPRKITVFHEYDRTAWRITEVWEDDSGKEFIPDDGVKQGIHNLGIVPIAILWTHRTGAMNFESAIRYAYHWDLEAFQDGADLRYDTYMHAHPMRFRKMARQKSKMPKLGPDSQVDLDPNLNEEAGYLKYPTEATNELRLNIQDAHAGLQRAAGMDPLGTSDFASAMGASGRARAISFTVGEARFLKRYARATRNAEQRMFEIAKRWEADAEDIPPEELLNTESPTYSQRFDTQAPDELVENWTSTRSNINSDEYDRQVQLKIADALLPDIPQEVRETIQEEIRENDLIGRVQDQPDPMDVLPGADPTDTVTTLEELAAGDVGLEDEEGDVDEEEAA